MIYGDIAQALAKDGLLARGGFLATAEDEAPASARSIILVGNAGPDFWPHFEAGRREEANPLDAWTRRVVDRIAAKAGGWGIYPSDGPPYFPFQRWARKVEPVFLSPIGLLIHPHYGLWHAYRAAICLHDPIDMPQRLSGENPCHSCADTPCLKTCPVSAFNREVGYDVPACAAHLRTMEGSDCMAEGCRARRACPIAGPGFYAPGQAAFHMQAFLAARGH